MRWIVSALEPPRVRRRCAGCRAVCEYLSSERFRVNANGKRIDVWLIYRCSRCDYRVNAPVFERARIDPGELARYEQNCPETARRCALDPAVTRRIGEPLAPPVAVERIDDGEHGVIVFELADPVRVRLDKLVARELRIPRSRLRHLRGWVTDGLRAQPLVE